MDLKLVEHLFHKIQEGEDAATVLANQSEDVARDVRALVEIAAQPGFDQFLEGSPMAALEEDPPTN